MTIDYLPWNRPAALARFAPDTFLAALSRYRATYFSAVPTTYARLAELPAEQLGDLSSVRFAHQVYGEVPAAYVVTYPDASVTAADLLALCRANLTKIKLPTAIHIVPDLPRNAIGKIDKPALRAWSR